MPPKKAPAPKKGKAPAPAGKKAPASTPPAPDSKNASKPSSKPPTPPPKELVIEREKRIFLLFPEPVVCSISKMIEAERFNTNVVGFANNNNNVETGPSPAASNDAEGEEKKPEEGSPQPIAEAPLGPIPSLAGMLQCCVAARALRPTVLGYPPPTPPKVETPKKEASPAKSTKKSTVTPKKSTASKSPSRGTPTSSTSGKESGSSVKEKEKDTSPSRKPAAPRWTAKADPKASTEGGGKPKMDAVHRQSPSSFPLLTALKAACEPQSYPLLHALTKPTETVEKPPKKTRPQALTESALKDSLPASPTSKSRSTRSRTLSPTSPAPNESQRRVAEQQRKTEEMREARKRREKEKMERELAAAREATQRARQREEEERAAKEQALAERLEQLRAKREARELEFLVGERRAHQVLQSKNLNDLIKERYENEQRVEEEKREAALLERRERLRQPVLVGLEEAEQRLQEVAERKKKRDAELRENWEALAKLKVKHHHGSSYELAVSEHIKSKHKHEDEKHSQLYRHAKMQEYGNLVKRLQEPQSAWETPGLDDDQQGLFEPSLLTSVRRKQKRSKASPSPLPSGPVEHNTPFITNNTTFQQRVTTTVAKPSLSQAERTKLGNQFLKEGIKNKDTPLPPGLKLSPIEDIKRENEYKRFKERKIKGDKYLREIRALPHAQTPDPRSMLKAGNPDEQYLRELKKLRTKASSLEHQLLAHPPNVDDAEECFEYNEQYLEVIRTKMALLQQVKQ